MLKKILLALIFAIFITTSTVVYAEIGAPVVPSGGGVYAPEVVEDNGMKIPASKAYVMTAVATRQDKIPAAGQPNVAEGETVMTYTAAGNGRIGERGIYTGANTYNANTDANKLITAGALTNAFTNLPTTDTTKLSCADPGTCSLWTIVDQTAYGNSGGASVDPAILAMLTALIDVNGGALCYKELSSGAVNAGGCSTLPSGYGDWGTVFTYNNATVQVNGISACSSVAEGLSRGGIPTNQSGVQADYESNMLAAPTTGPAGGYCYCKLTDPASSSWVYLTSYGANCAVSCASGCAFNVRTRADFRGGMFGSVTQ